MITQSAFDIKPVYVCPTDGDITDVIEIGVIRANSNREVIEVSCAQCHRPVTPLVDSDGNQIEWYLGGED
jgi:hypothetical protein